MARAPFAPTKVIRSRFHSGGLDRLLDTRVERRLLVPIGARELLEDLR